MLVLSRKVGESIKIDEDIIITVLEVKGSTVKLGIKAPGSYRILRAELEFFDETPPARDAA